MTGTGHDDLMALLAGDIPRPHRLLTQTTGLWVRDRIAAVGRTVLCWFHPSLEGCDVIFILMVFKGRTLLVVILSGSSPISV